jgi:hypothetical protein
VVTLRGTPLGFSTWMVMTWISLTLQEIRGFGCGG